MVPLVGVRERESHLLYCQRRSYDTRRMRKKADGGKKVITTADAKEEGERERERKVGGRGCSGSRKRKWNSEWVGNFIAVIAKKKKGEKGEKNIRRKKFLIAGSTWQRPFPPPSINRRFSPL